MSYCQNRADDSETDKFKLLQVVARRARLTDTQILYSLLPGWRTAQISYLRNAKPDHFGWERLRFAAKQLGVTVSISISEAA